MSAFEESSQVPSSEPAPGTNAASLKDQAVNDFLFTDRTSSLTNQGAASTPNSVKNHPVTQDLANGPVATSVKNEAGATSNEFGNLAGARAPPSYSAANDTPLTHYHSFFYTLLSWENPRATGITFAVSVLFIFAFRYLPVIRYLLKLSWVTLGVVTVTEVAATTLFGTSITSSIRPRQYFRLPKEALEATLDDVEQMINFFVIEFQRILFAENIPATAAAFGASFISYYLVKLLPLWGMALLSTSVLFLAPLVYVLNKEFIDAHVENTSKIVSQQAQQVKSLAGEHAGKGFEAVKSYTGDYTAKATEYIGKSRQKIPTPQSGVKEGDFPNAPKHELPSESATTAPAPVPAS